MALGDSQVTRMPNGMTNNGQDSIFADLAALDPTQAHVYMQDFDTYTAADFTVTDVGAASQALDNEESIRMHLKQRIEFLKKSILADAKNTLKI